MPRFIDISGTPPIAAAADVRAAIATYATQPVHFSASTLSNGALPSTGTLDSGHPYLTTGSGGFAVANGGIMSDAATAYLNFGPLSGPIKEFSVEMFWSDDGEAGEDTVVMIVADGPFANNYPTYANSGAHFLIHRKSFTYQKRAGSSGTGVGVTTKTYNYKTPIPYGQKATIRLLWDGTNAVVVMHDGTVVPIPYDADYATWWGSYGCVEILGAASGTNTAYVTQFNATAESRAVDAPLTAARLVDSMQTETVTATSTPITTALSAKLFGLSVPIPPSRRVLITGQVFVEQTVPVTRSASTLALGVYVAGVSSHGKLTTIYSGYTPANASADAVLDADRNGDMSSYANGILIPFSLILTPAAAFAIGDVQDFQVKMQASANGQWAFIDSGGGTGFSGIRRSTMSIYELPAV